MEVAQDGRAGLVVGEGPPKGSGPSQRNINRAGYGYLRANFPEISYIKRASFLEMKGDGSVTGSPPASTAAGAAGTAGVK